MTQLIDYLKSEDVPFVQKQLYEPITDSLILYIHNKRSYAKRIGAYLTIFLAVEDDSLVGIEFKGVKTLIKAIESEGLAQIVALPKMSLNENGSGQL